MQTAGQRVLQNIPILIRHTDAEGRADWFNTSWLDYTGRPLLQETGELWLTSVHPDDQQPLKTGLRTAFARREAYCLEYRLRNHQGSYRWLREQGLPDQDGKGYTCFGHDIDELKTALHSLEELQCALRQAQEIARVGYYTYDIRGDHWESPYILNQIFGIDDNYPHTLQGWLDLVVPESRAEMENYLQDVFRQKAPFQREYRIRRPRDGELRWVQGEGRISYDESGQPLAMVGTIRDVTDEVAIKRTLSIDAAVFDHSQQAILITDNDRHIVKVNSAFTRVMGYTLEEVQGQNPRILNSGLQDASFYESMWHTLHYTGQWRNEIWNRRKDGTMCPGILDINAVRDEHGQIVHYVGVFTEITELKNTQRTLERLVNFDALTGLPNRVLMMDRLNHALSQSNRYNRMIAVCFLDLDNFKPVNDNHGHAYGDALLVEVANRLTAAVRGGDTIARLGGDEFILILTELEHGYEIAPTLDRVMSSVARPYCIEGATFSITASLGATLFPRDFSDADTLLRHADLAMYRAKQAGRNRYQIYAPED